MNFEKLRDKHRSAIVRHATRLYGIQSAPAPQQQAIDQFLASGDLQALLAALKTPNHLHVNPDPQPVPAVLSVQEGTGSIRVCESDLVFCAGETRQVKVEVKNLSAATWQTDEQTPAFLSYHWYAENGEVCDFDGRRTLLSQAILPGESKQLTVNVQPCNGTGNYLLEVTMVMEGKFWFEQCGLNTRREPAKITPPKLPPHVNRIYKDLMAAIEKQKQEVV